MGQEPRGGPEIPQGLSKDWKKLAEAMRNHSWTFEEGRKHVKAFAPDGITWGTLSKTPSDVRSFRNARAKFRRWCRDRRLEPGI
jgi:hypothetical protein